MGVMTIVACTASLCLGLISGFLIGRKHPKIADDVVAEANKLTGKQGP